MVRLNVLKANALYEGLRILKSRALFFQLLTGGIFVVSALLERAVVGELIEEGFSHETLPPGLIAMQAKILGGGFTSDPVLTLYGFAMAFFVIPGLALLFGSSQFNEDVSTGHVRLLLVRMSRKELVISRFLNTFFLWVLIAGGSSAFGAYLLTSETQDWVISAGFTTVSPLFIGLGCALYGAPILAYGALLNTIFRKPVTVIVGGFLLWSIPDILFTLSPALESALEGLWPESAGMHLLLPGGQWWTGAGLSALYTGVLLGGAVAIFSRKELR